MLKCDECGMLVNKRYYVIHPRTSQPVRVCRTCEGEWSQLPERQTVTEAEYHVRAGGYMCLRPRSVSIAAGRS